MIQTRSQKYGVPMYVLYPGDYFATRENCVIMTVTGACLVVCLYDHIRGLGGMGHFIIPGMIGTEGIISSEIAEHGVVNLEYIMGEIVKLGGDRKNLKAKLFGGGYSGGVSNPIVRSNIQFLHDYFRMENIPVDKEDLGGDVRREIIFRPITGDVFRKILKHNEGQSEFTKLEKEYIDKVFKGKEIKTHFVLFE